MQSCWPAPLRRRGDAASRRCRLTVRVLQTNVTNCMMLAALPPLWGSVLAGVAGLAAGAYVNWAAYTLAWNWRPISPWARPHPEAPRRLASDRLPLYGWFGLRREAPLHGRHFW